MVGRTILILSILALAPGAGAFRIDGLPAELDVSPEQSCGATARDDPDGTSHQTTTCFTGVNADVGDAPVRAGREDACTRSTNPGGADEPSTRIETCRSGIVASGNGGSRVFAGTQEIVVERCQGTTCTGAATTDLLVEARPLPGGPSWRVTFPLPVALLP